MKYFLKNKLLLLHTLLTVIFFISIAILTLFDLKYRWYVTTIYIVYIILGYYIYLIKLYSSIFPKLTMFKNFLIGLIVTIIPILLICIGYTHLLLNGLHPEQLLTIKNQAYVCEIYDLDPSSKKIYCYSYQNNPLTRGRIPLLIIEYRTINANSVSIIYTYYDSSGNVMYSIEE